MLASEGAVLAQLGEDGATAASRLFLVPGRSRRGGVVKSKHYARTPCWSGPRALGAVGRPSYSPVGKREVEQWLRVCLHGQSSSSSLASKVAGSDGLWR